MKFALYLMRRLIKPLLLFVTSPIWVPLALFIAVVLYLAAEAHEWFEGVRKDFEGRP